MNGLTRCEIKGAVITIFSQTASYSGKPPQQQYTVAGTSPRLCSSLASCLLFSLPGFGLYRWHCSLAVRYDDSTNRLRNSATSPFIPVCSSLVLIFALESWFWSYRSRNPRSHPARNASRPSHSTCVSRGHT